MAPDPGHSSWHAGALLLVCLSALSAAAEAATFSLRVATLLGSTGQCAALADAHNGFQYFTSLLGSSSLRITDRSGGAHVLRFAYNRVDDPCNSDASHAVVLATLLDPSRAQFVLGTGHPYALAEAQQVNAKGRVWIGCCQTPDVIYEQGLNFVFGIDASSSKSALQAVRAMALSGAVTKLAVLYPTDVDPLRRACQAAGDSMQQLKELGSSMALGQNFTHTQADVQPTAAGYFQQMAKSIVASGADALLACEPEDQAVLLAQALVAEGFDPRALFITNTATEGFVQKLGERAEHTMSAVQWHPSIQWSDPVVGTASAYAQRYTEQFGRAPSAIAASATASAYVLALAVSEAFVYCDIAAARSESDQLLFNVSAINCTDSYGNPRSVRGYDLVRESLETLEADTFFGPIQFNRARRNTIKNPATTQVLGGKLAVVLPSDIATKELVMPRPSSSGETGRGWVIPVAVVLGVLALALLLLLAWKLGDRLLVIGRKAAADEVMQDLLVIPYRELTVTVEPQINSETDYEPGRGQYRGTTVLLQPVLELPRMHPTFDMAHMTRSITVPMRITPAVPNGNNSGRGANSGPLIPMPDLTKIFGTPKVAATPQPAFVKELARCLASGAAQAQLVASASQQGTASPEAGSSMNDATRLSPNSRRNSPVTNGGQQQRERASPNLRPVTVSGKMAAMMHHNSPRVAPSGPTTGNAPTVPPHRLTGERGGHVNSYGGASMPQGMAPVGRVQSVLWPASRQMTLHSDSDKQQLLMLAMHLTRLQHANVVSVLGVCFDCEGLKGVPLLVTQHEEFGTLASVLDNKMITIDIFKKHDIASDVAGALAYLHAQTPPLSLRALHASRILLDRKFKAKVVVDNTSLAAMPNQLSVITEKDNVYAFGELLCLLYRDRIRKSIAESVRALKSTATSAQSRNTSAKSDFSTFMPSMRESGNASRHESVAGVGAYLDVAKTGSPSYRPHRKHTSSVNAVRRSSRSENSRHLSDPNSASTARGGLSTAATDSHSSAHEVGHPVGHPSEGLAHNTSSSSSRADAKEPGSGQGAPGRPEPIGEGAEALREDEGERLSSSSTRMEPLLTSSSMALPPWEGCSSLLITSPSGGCGARGGAGGPVAEAAEEAAAGGGGERRGSVTGEESPERVSPNRKTPTGILRRPSQWGLNGEPLGGSAGAAPAAPGAAVAGTMTPCNGSANSGGADAFGQRTSATMKLRFALDGEGGSSGNKPPSGSNNTSGADRPSGMDAAHAGSGGKSAAGAAPHAAPSPQHSAGHDGANAHHHHHKHGEDRPSLEARDLIARAQSVSAAAAAAVRAVEAEQKQKAEKQKEHERRLMADAKGDNSHACSETEGGEEEGAVGEEEMDSEDDDRLGPANPMVISVIKELHPIIGALIEDCVRPEMAARPTFAQIVEVLQTAVKNPLGAGHHTGEHDADPSSFGAVSNTSGPGLSTSTRQPSHTDNRADPLGGTGTTVGGHSIITRTKRPSNQGQGASGQGRRWTSNGGAGGALGGQSMRFAANGSNPLRAKHINNDDLLYEVFPPKVAEALKNGREPEPEQYNSVSVLFMDVVGYTVLCSQLQPYEVMDMLHRLYSKFDRLCKDYALFKGETIGDAYLCVANLLHPQPTDHAKRVAEFAFDALQEANETIVSADHPELGTLSIRCGMHVGPAVASVVGTINRRYCLFGDTVNLASRMESTSEPNLVQCTRAFCTLVKQQWPEIEAKSRGVIDVKGKGSMETFFLTPPALPQLLPLPPGASPTSLGGASARAPKGSSPEGVSFDADEPSTPGVNGAPTPGRVTYSGVEGHDKMALPKRHVSFSRKLAITFNQDTPDDGSLTSGQNTHGTLSMATTGTTPSLAPSMKLPSCSSAATTGAASYADDCLDSGDAPLSEAALDATPHPPAAAAAAAAAWSAPPAAAAGSAPPAATAAGEATSSAAAHHDPAAAAPPPPPPPANSGGGAQPPPSASRLRISSVAGASPQQQAGAQPGGAAQAQGGLPPLLPLLRAGAALGHTMDGELLSPAKGSSSVQQQQQQQPGVRGGSAVEGPKPATIRLSLPGEADE